MYIVINDDIVLDDVYLNCNTYVSKNRIEEAPSIFHLIVLDDEDNIVEEIENAYLTSNYPNNEGEYFICFGEVDEKELRYEKQQAQIEYLAMMSDIDLEEGA